MFGRAGGPGGRGNRPWAAHGSCRPPDVTAPWIPIGVDPFRNSTIQSAVSTRISSVTSSEKRRRTPRQRSVASAAVPSVGPSTSRTLSEAQSNCNARRRRWTAWAVATSLIQPEVTPKYRSTATQATANSSPR